MRLWWFPWLGWLTVAGCGASAGTGAAPAKPAAPAGPTCATSAACFTAAEDLRHGANGQTKDPTRAAAAYQKSCELAHAGACDALAMMYYGGEGVPKDALKGDTLEDRACTLRFAPACFGLAYVLSTNVNQLLSGQGEVSDEERGKLVEDLRGKARGYLKRACELGSPCACAALETGDCNQPEMCAAKSPAGACLTRCSEEPGCDNGAFGVIGQ
ncbi:MAG: sel1 repeat family protein [Myxococcales bacterium]|nr:sel1 repeat family protein [Myxococcales bacterium]